MKRKILLYILPLLSIFAISCNDEYINGNLNNTGAGTDYISLEIDVPDMRTRAIDMNPGAPLYLNDIWVGIYRRSDGVRVGGTKEPIILGNRMTASGATLLDVVQIEGYDLPTGITLADTDEFCVVGVANYDGLMTTNKIDGNPEYLIEALEKAGNWNDFINISVNTTQTFPDNTPLLMGYLHLIEGKTDEKSYVYTKVDQFKEYNAQTNPFVINLKGEMDDMEDWWVKANVENNKLKSIKTEGKILKLRRLRLKNNINISTKEGVVITNLQYKVFNTPNSAFLAQRRTNTFIGDCINKTGGDFSPNSADVYEDGYGYIDWVTPADSYHFSFEHFENKHWALPGAQLSEYHDREARLTGKPVDGNAVFKVLAGNVDYWNNNATYMVLRMNIRDENYGRNAEIDYVIHEGFINDEDGKDATDDLNTRLQDFSCIRNTDYYYDITINSVNDIETFVSTNNTSHPNDQFGKIWEFEYIKEENSPLNHLFFEPEYSEDNTKEISKVIEFENKDGIAFRLVGDVYDKGTFHPVDVCYNFARGDLKGFDGLWKDQTSATEYLVTISNQGGQNYKSKFDVMKEYFEDNKNNSYLNTLLEGIKVKVEGEDDYKTIKDYIIDIEENKKSSKIVSFQFKNNLDYKADKDGYADEPELFMRGLYIFDINKVNNYYGIGTSKDTDGCIIYKIYAAEQYPYYDTRKTISFTEADILWTSEFYQTLDGDNSHWCGGRDVITEMFWKHKEGIDGYTVTIFDPDAKVLKGEKVEITKNNLNNYIEEYNGMEIIRCPFPVPGYSRNFDYDVIITPQVDQKSIKLENQSLTLNNALRIRFDNPSTNENSTWDFSRDIWSNLNASMFSKGAKPIIYSGFVLNHDDPDAGIVDTDFKGTNNTKISYIQLRAGNKDNNYMSVYLYKPGKLYIYADHSKSDETRQVYIYKEENGELSRVETADVKGANINNAADALNKVTKIEIDVDVQKPTKYRIFSDKVMRYYKINFERKQ